MYARPRCRRPRCRERIIKLDTHLVFGVREDWVSLLVLLVVTCAVFGVFILHSVVLVFALIFWGVIDLYIFVGLRRSSSIVSLFAVKLALVMVLVLLLDYLARHRNPGVRPFEVLEVRQLVSWMED